MTGPSPALALGLDLGGTNVKAAVLDLAGDEPRVVATRMTPTRSEDGPIAVLDRVAALGRGVFESLGGGTAPTAGLGLPGHFDAAAGTGVLLPNLRGDWVGQPIAAPVSAGLGLPVALVNDVRALTLAELRMGAGRGTRDLVCVALGTGVGGGVVIGGGLHLGTGHAGEIGHVTVAPDGPVCGCGNRGCLDRVAGAQVIAAAGGQPSFEALLAAAQTGDARATAALADAARAVGSALASAVVLLWPQRVVVGGGVAEAGELVLGPLRETVRARACVVPPESYDIVRAELGPWAGAIGAALWGRQEAGVTVEAPGLPA